MYSERMRLSLLWAVPVTVLSALLISGCPGDASDLTPTPGQSSRRFNSPPTVVLTADIVRGVAPLTVRFDSSGSTDDGLIVSRLWDFGDDTTSQAISPTHTFQTNGDFTVTLTLTDDDNASASRSIVISVTDAPVAVITVDSTTAESAPATFQFDGTSSYDPDGTITAYRWNFGDGATETLAAVPHTFGSPGTYRVRLTVTDNKGVTGTAQQIIRVGIPQPEIAFRVPPAGVKNIVVAPSSQLWVAATYDVAPGALYMLSAGLDRDLDPCDAQAVIHSAATGDVLFRLEGATAPVRAVAFSPDGTRALVSGDDGTLRMYDAETGDLLDEDVVDGGAPVTAVAFSAGGDRYVHGGTDGSVVLRRAADGQVIRTFGGHGAAVNAVAFSPDEARVASAGDDSAVIVWDVSSGAGLVVLDASDGGHALPVNAVAFSPLSPLLLASGSSDGTAILWNIPSQIVLSRLSGHTAAVTSVAFSPDGLALATGSADRTVKLWNISTGATTAALTLSGHSAAVTAVAFAPGITELLSGSADGTARLWNINTATTIQTLAPCQSTISSLAYSSDGTRVLLGVAAQNSIPLDTTPSGGSDLNLRVPTALNLSSLTAADQGRWYLWMQIDTDRTDPVRTYSEAVVNVVGAYGQTLATAPVVPLVDSTALVVAQPTTARQICRLGTPLIAGDQLVLSLATIPGYGPAYDNDVFSVLVLDENEEVFVWYQDGVPFGPNDVLVIDAPTATDYYLVLDGCGAAQCGANYLAPSVMVRVIPAAEAVNFDPPRQDVYLNFSGAAGLTVGAVGPLDIAPFDASDLNGLWGSAETQAIKTQVRTQLEAVFNGYNVRFSADPAELVPPYTTVYFGSDAVPFAAVSFLDPRNQTRSGTALVATDAIADRYDSFSAVQYGTAFGNVAAHVLGLSFGLRASQGDETDLMDVAFMLEETRIYSTLSVRFRVSPLLGTQQYNGQIGIQNAPQILSSVLGPE
jgi:WD40 repeat protein